MRARILMLLLGIIWIGLNSNAVKANAKIDTLQMQAIMLVHADITGFSINSEYSSIEKIVQDYNATVLQVKGVNDCLVFKIIPTSPCCKCEFVIAYNFNDKNFYRLLGFRTNEFSDFYNLVLLSGNVPNLKPASSKKIHNYILGSVAIEGYDIGNAYRRYYGKCKNSMYDTTSCYRKSIIRAY